MPFAMSYRATLSYPGVRFCIFPMLPQPLVLERVTLEADAASVAWKHTKALYRLTPQSMGVLKVGRQAGPSGSE
jgi:hypothetical protein